MKRPPPAVAAYLLAPFLAEVMSTSTSIVFFLAPWSLIPNAILYGGGVLLIREATRRLGWGLPGVIALGAAYGVFEEASLLRTWFAPEFLESHADYSRVWHTSILLAGHLTAFHTAVSIGASIALVEWLYPGHSARAWAGRRGLSLAALGPAALLAVSWLFPDEFYPIYWGPVLSSLGLVIALVVLASRLPRRWPRATGGDSRRAYAAAIAAASVTHFALVWTVPAIGIAWPIGVVLAMSPVLVGLLAVPRVLPSSRSDQQTGLVLGLMWPLVGLDLVVATSGRLDAVAAAVVGVVGLWWLSRATEREDSTPLLWVP